MESDNPYRPSEHPAEAEYRPQRSPLSITVFGVLNLLFGLLGILGAVMFLIMMGAGGGGAGLPNPAFDAMGKSLIFNGWTWFSTICGLVASVVLVISGIALLRQKSLGRRLAIYYAWYAIIVALIGAVMGMIYVYGPMFADLGDSPGGVIPVIIGAVFGTAISILYPVLMMYFMYRPAVISALHEGVNPFHG